MFYCYSFWNTFNSNQILLIKWLLCWMIKKKKKKKKKNLKSSPFFTHWGLLGFGLWIEPLATWAGLSSSSTALRADLTLWNMIALHWLPESTVCWQSPKTGPELLLWWEPRRNSSCEPLPTAVVCNLNIMKGTTAKPLQFLPTKEPLQSLSLKAITAKGFRAKVTALLTERKCLLQRSNGKTCRERIKQVKPEIITVFFMESTTFGCCVNNVKEQAHTFGWQWGFGEV